MKELSIEQKAKAYDEAVERARKIHNDTEFDYEKGMVEEIFPELAMSEDEKIRKKFIKLVKMSSEVGGFALHKWEADEMLAWLEKQGEQKPIINVPPREVILAIWDLGNEWKELTNGSISTEYGTQLDYIQKHWHESEYYLREKQGEQNDSDVKDYNSIDPHFGKSIDNIEPKFKNGQWIVWQNKCYKVNYNGCGYELIDQNGLRTSLEYGTVDKSAHLLTIDDVQNGCKFGAKWQGKHDVSEDWSEEDEEHIHSLLDRLEGMCKKGSTFITTRFAVSQDMDWLKSLRPQPKQWWGEEDERIYQSIIDDTVQENQLDSKQIDWLKSIKSRVQPKQEWSEEDDERIRKALIEYFGEQCDMSDWNGVYGYQVFAWLKSLKSQNHWKPSEEQMKQLGWIAEQNKDNMIGKELMTLYEDLNKLQKRI